MIGLCPKCDRKVEIINGYIESHTYSTGWLDQIKDCPVERNYFADRFRYPKLTCPVCGTRDVFMYGNELVEHYSADYKTACSCKGC